MLKTIFDPIAVGDSRSISVRVNPNDEITADSATYTITRRKDPAGVVWDTGGACVVKNDNYGTLITLPDFIDFPTVDLYIVRYRIYWADGQIDNTVCAHIPVQAVCGGSCGC